MSELVTGEAVALELRPARLPSRALAVLLDLLVAVVAYILVTVALVASTASLDEAAQFAVSLAAFVIVMVGGPIAVETLSHGRSLGKMACGLRVVRDDGGPIRFRHALVRGGIGVIEILLTFGVVACIASLVSARGRRLGDVFAGTLVVRERVPVSTSGFLPRRRPGWQDGSPGLICRRFPTGCGWPFVSTWRGCSSSILRSARSWPSGWPPTSSRVRGLRRRTVFRRRRIWRRSCRSGRPERYGGLSRTVR